MGSEKKVLFVTGAANGIGKQFAQEALADGHRVVAADLHLEALQYAFPEKNPNLLKVKLDVSQYHEWFKAYNAVLEHFGKIDVLLNIAGFIEPGYIDQSTKASADTHIKTNLLGTIYGTQIFASHMKENRKGHIINIASLAGVSAVPGVSLYCASKFGVRGFTLSISNELKQFGVHTTLICPDLVNTNMLDKQLQYKESNIAFSGPKKPLEATDITKIIFKEMRHPKNVEVLVPWSRGVLARLVSSFPWLIAPLKNVLYKIGNKQRLKQLEERSQNQSDKKAA